MIQHFLNERVTNHQDLFVQNICRLDKLKDSVVQVGHLCHFPEKKKKSHETMKHRWHLGILLFLNFKSITVGKKKFITFIFKTTYFVNNLNI